MKVIKFTKNHSPYVEGEIASFSDEDADVRIQAGVAELVKEYDKQPDVRTEQVFDEQGNPTGTVQQRMVPDDLERNVDLPPTKAGGQPKAEENMTDEEKEAAKSVDAAPVNKMVNSPSKKK